MSSTCVLYVRKSTDREDKQILSIPAQLTELRRFAAREGLSISQELVEHYSAREPGRPIFSKLLANVASGKVERILTWKLDRLARNPIDGGALIHYLGKGLLKELVTPEGRYTGAGDSKFMLSVLFGAATKMTDDLAVGVKRGNRAIHERGRITGVPPVGYMKVRDTQFFRGAGQVIADPERFEVIRKIWRAALSGEPIADIWRKAISKWGFTLRATRKLPVRVPSMNYLYNILENRFYTGQLVRCGEVFRGEHPPMITLHEFEEVQRILRPASIPHQKIHDFLYRGMLLCGACGRLLTGEIHRGQYIYYRCGRRRVGRVRCIQPGPSEAQVTRDIEHSLARIALPSELIEWTLSAVDVWLEQQTAAGFSEARAREQELEQLERQTGKLTDLVVAGTISETDYVERKARLLERKEALNRLLAEPMAAEAEWRAAISEVLQSSESLLSGFQRGNPDERRGLMRHVYENCFVKDRITTPALRFPWSAFVESRPDSTTTTEGYANMPSPSDIVLNQRKNAHPRNDRERAFRTWWTQILRTRTKIEQVN